MPKLFKQMSGTGSEPVPDGICFGSPEGGDAARLRAVLNYDAQCLLYLVGIVTLHYNDLCKLTSPK